MELNLVAATEDDKPVRTTDEEVIQEFDSSQVDQ